MELKKNKKYDLEHKRPLFFGIGMIISLSLTLLAFEWKSPIEPVMHSFNQEYESVDEFIVPPTDIKPPPPPPPSTPIIKSTVEEPKEEIEVTIDAEITDEESVVILIPTEISEEKVDEAPKNWAEVMPTFEGGMQNFYKFLGKNIHYPKQAQRMGIEGRVVVQFVVEKDGTLTDLKVLKGIGAGCDEEAIRVMKKVPKFLPGKQGDIRVRVQMVVPINFTLK
ncbi:energy transducer TonB [Ekhidna sp.]|uniref:energy transducer TonB n=1 Tax=Ekhidna sp. TaxID=2608089 RepID=UPI00329A64DC